MSDEKELSILKLKNMKIEDFIEDYLNIKLMWYQKLYIRMIEKFNRNLYKRWWYERLILCGM